METISNEVLQDFLSEPLCSGEAILARFAGLPNAVYRSGACPLERFVYVPGSRRDRVLLIAHTDTVWDRAYRGENAPAAAAWKEENGVITSTDEAYGIGADDRAGCAALWLLRESGHSLLLVDGEERGHLGAKLAVADKPLLRELNRHRWLAELDLPGTREYSFKGIPATRRFRRLLENHGYRRSACKGGSDVPYLCRGRCGVNLSIGYAGHHTPKERIALADWQENVRALAALLEGPQRGCRWSHIGKLVLRLRGVLGTWKQRWKQRKKR